MLIKKIADERFLKIILALLLSYYFGKLYLQYDLKILMLFMIVFFIIFFLKKTDYAFYFILATRPLIDIFYSESATIGRVGQLVGAGITVLFVVYLITYVFFICRFNIFTLYINKIYGFFFLMSFFSIFFSESISSGVFFWVRLFQGFILLNLTVLILISSGSAFFKRKVRLICWSAGIALIYPLLKFYYLFFFGHGANIDGYVRYSLFGAHHNVFSYILLSILPFCFLLYSVSNKGVAKNLWLVSFAIMIYTIYISYTRNVWIGITVILFFLILLNKKYLLGYLLLFSVLLVVSLSAEVRERLNDLFVIVRGGSFFELDPVLLSGRIGIWQNNIRYFIENSSLLEKLFGNGYDIYMRVGGYVRSGKPAPEHNSYLTLLMSTGLVGLSLYIIYIGSLLYESFQLLKRATDNYLKNIARINISVLFAYIVLCSSSHMLWKITFQYYLSVFAGFVIAGNIMINKSHVYGKESVVAEKIE